MKQLSIFPQERRAPRKLMHVVDAGDADKPIVLFRCERCDYESGWVYSQGLSKDKRGEPCPNCNRAN